MPVTTQNQRRSAVVLVAEENLTDVYMIQEVLKHSRYAIHPEVVYSGEEALSYLRHEGGHADTADPDLLLLDLNLPKMDGWKVLEAVKKDPRLNRMPVLLVSSSWNKEDEARAHDLRADYYLVKPLDMVHFPMLIQAVERVLAA